MQEERDLFCNYVQNLTLVDLADIEPLPYRRTLNKEEHQFPWAQMRERWGVQEGNYWHPLMSLELPPNIIAFQQAWFDDAMPLTTLHHLLVLQR